MTQNIEPKTLPCRCKNGHAYTREEARDRKCTCDICDEPIVCHPPQDGDCGHKDTQ